MTEILVLLIGEQAAPNALVLLEPNFSHITKYWFVSTEKMEKQGRTQHLVTACKMDSADVKLFIVPPDDPSGVIELLKNAHRDEYRYTVSLTGSTKMIGAGAWSYFTGNGINAKIFYVLSGVNAYRMVHPSDQSGDYPLSYRFTVSTYLRAYGVAYDEPKYDYKTNANTEQQLLQDFLTDKQPVTDIGMTTLSFAYELNRHLEAEEDSSEQLVSYESVTWLSAWLEHIHFLPGSAKGITESEINYLQSLWFEHYVARTIARALRLPRTAYAHGWTLYPANDGERLAGRIHEFDLLFCYQNKLYVIEAKIGLGKGRRGQLKTDFNNVLFRLAALRRDYGFHVKTILVTLTDKLRKGKGKPLQNHFAREADLLNVKVVDRAMLEHGAETWVAELVGVN